MWSTTKITIDDVLDHIKVMGYMRLTATETVVHGCATEGPEPAVLQQSDKWYSISTKCAAALTM